MLTIQIGMKSLKAAEAELKADSTVGISIRVKKFSVLEELNLELYMYIIIIIRELHSFSTLSKSTKVW